MAPPGLMPPTEVRRSAWTRRIERGEGAVGRPQEAVTHEVRVKVGSRDRPRRVDAGGLVPLTAPGTSNVVKVPSGARRKP